MAEAAAPAVVTATEPQKGKLKTILVAVIALGIIGAAAYVFLLGGSSTTDEAAAEPEPAEVAVADGEVIDVATMTVNLAGGSEQYARVGFAVVLSAEADPSAVEARFALLKDAALTRISGYAAADLLSPEGLAGLRLDLTEAAGEVWPDGEVNRVVLTELIVQ